MRQPLLSAASTTEIHAARPALLFNPDATLIGSVHQRALARPRVLPPEPRAG